MGLTVDTDTLSSDKLFGKQPSDLQSNIVIGDNAITGTLKYVSDYSSAGYTDDEESGNFIALHCTSNVEDAVITAQLVNGVHGAVTLDEDKICIFRISDKSTQSIKFTATADGYESVSAEYALTDLELLNA